MSNDIVVCLFIYDSAKNIKVMSGDSRQNINQYTKIKQYRMGYTIQSLYTKIQKLYLYHEGFRRTLPPFQIQ
jgi:hypothetical protein